MQSERKLCGHQSRREFLKYGIYGSLAAGLSSSLWLTGCGKSDSPLNQPNILWIVWDTVRRDHLSLYRYDKPTTPYLDSWARGARIFDNCISIANTTVPTHASMFTGLMPSEHQRNNTHNYLGDNFTTVAELLDQSGYQTYMYSANPHISRSRNFIQGFDIVEHPWDDRYKDEVLQRLRKKIVSQNRFNGAPKKIASHIPSSLLFKDGGELPQRRVTQWLRKCRSSKPFFIFLNYMEAHQPYLPMEVYRERLMSPGQVQKSYRIDRSLVPMRNYTFGLKEYSEEEIEITRLTYDATVAELDGLLENLLKSLQADGYLDNTIVILTSDHGEHLGDHHMLDHQYSVYESLIQVPLVIHYPKCLSPARDTRPVINSDLFCTVLELAGIGIPEPLQGKMVSLLKPQEERIRVAECPAYPTHCFRLVKRFSPDFDPMPWSRTLRAVYQGKYKYIWASDGKHELYDLEADPGELKNLIEIETNLAKKLAGNHDEWVARLKAVKAKAQQDRALTEQERRRLESLGYAGSRKSR